MNINDSELRSLKQDKDGLLTYEFIANHIDELDSDNLSKLVDVMIDVDLNGQFLASAARYLHAIDSARHSEAVSRLVAATIDKDREHRYLSDILTGIYGTDFQSRAAELSATDNNFRRIYKRLYPNSVI